MNNKQKVINKLKGLQEFLVLQRDFSYIKPKDKYAFYQVEAKDEEDAWEQTQEDISNTNSQEWLMTREEVEYLIKFLQEKLNEQ